MAPAIAPTRVPTVVGTEGVHGGGATHGRGRPDARAPVAPRPGPTYCQCPRHLL